MGERLVLQHWDKLIHQNNQIEGTKTKTNWSQICPTHSTGPCSIVRLQGISEKIMWGPTSKMVAPLVGSHLQWKELLWLAETLSKMAAVMAGNHLQLKEQLSLAETDGHLGSSLGRCCLLYQKCDTSESTRWQMLNAYWQRKCYGVDSEVYPECGPVA